MSQYVPLDNIDHADLRVAIRHGAAFGDAVNQVLVFPPEFEAVQRDLPIVFRRDADWYAVALTGLDPDENLFLGPGGWTTRHVPAVLRRGPFITRPPAPGAAPDAARDIWIDLDDPRVGTEGGEPLFLRHGGAAPYLRHVTAALDELRRGHAAAAAIHAALAEQGLFKPARIEAEIPDGPTYRIEDVFTIDTDRLAVLDGAALGDLHRRGALAAAFMAAASLGNVARLIERKREAMR